MENKNSDWWHHAAKPVVAEKWYNNKVKLWLSLLFWPMFVYGMYQTKAYTKKNKEIISIICIVLLVLVSTQHDKTDTSSSQPHWVSYWNHSVYSVEQYIKHDYLRDPGSYEGIKWYLPEKNSDGTYNVMHTFRARNGFGGMNEETKTFIVSSDGEQVLGVQ